MHAGVLHMYVMNMWGVYVCDVYVGVHAVALHMYVICMCVCMQVAVHMNVVHIEARSQYSSICLYLIF